MSNVAQQVSGNASAGLLFPLSGVTIPRPTLIPFEKWRALPIDERAPVESVVMFEIVEKRLKAVIFDTVADRLVWWFDEPLDVMAGLYLGILGPPDGPPRGTLMVSAPSNNPSLRAHPPGARSTRRVSDEAGHLSDIAASALPGPGGPTGPGGKLLCLMAKLLRLAAETSLVTINEVTSALTQLPALTNDHSRL